MAASSSTVSDGNDALASQYNNLRADLMGHDHTDYTGQLSNAAIAAAAAIAESKLAFGDSGHAHTGGGGGKQLDWDNCWSDAVHSHQSAAEGGTLYQYSHFAWGLKGDISTGNEQGMKFIVPYGMTAIEVFAYTGGGTCSIRIQKATSNVCTLSSIGTSVKNSTFSSALTEEQILTLDITAVSSCSDVWVMLKCRHALPSS